MSRYGEPSAKAVYPQSPTPSNAFSAESRSHGINGSRKTQQHFNDSFDPIPSAAQKYSVNKPRLPRIFPSTNHQDTTPNTQKIKTPEHSPGSKKSPQKIRYLAFFIRFTTPASECSFIAATASPLTFLIHPATALSSSENQFPAVASNRSPSPICFAGTFSFAPPCGPFRCTISPALCSSRNIRRTITALSPSVSAIAADVCIVSGSLARTASTRTLN
jgi:hypothetical protein